MANEKTILEEQLKQGMTKLGIVERVSRYSRDNLAVLTQEGILLRLDTFLRAGLNSDGLHSLRVGLMSLPIIDFLGITDQKFKQDFFTAYTLHDIGKPRFYIWFNGKTMQPDVKNVHTRIEHLDPRLDERVMGIIERSHYYRKGGYPKRPKIPETPEIKISAQILGIVDSRDALRTRINSSTTLSDKDKAGGRVLPSEETIRVKLIETYGGLDLDYPGVLMPNLKLTGQEFIEEMYNRRIFLE